MLFVHWTHQIIEGMEEIVSHLLFHIHHNCRCFGNIVSEDWNSILKVLQVVSWSDVHQNIFLVLWNGQIGNLTPQILRKSNYEVNYHLEEEPCIMANRGSFKQVSVHQRHQLDSIILWLPWKHKNTYFKEIWLYLTPCLLIYWSLENLTESLKTPCRS